MLARGTAAHPAERAWLEACRPAYRALLAEDPVTEALAAAAIRPRWTSALVTAPPLWPAEETFTARVPQILQLTREEALEDLAVGLGRAAPRILHRDDLPERACGLLQWTWTHAVEPHWPRRRRILETDIVARTARLALGGWATAISGMRPGMRWLGGGRLQINSNANPPRELSGADLFFVPVTMSGGWVNWTMPALGKTPACDPGGLPRRFAVMYPCAGALTRTGSDLPATSALNALLGPARAEILVRLDTPKSTTHLVALTGQSLGAVGRHLTILRDSGLLRRSRAGRSVLYYRTPLGDDLVGARQ